MRNEIGVGDVVWDAFIFEDDRAYTVEGPDDPHVGPCGFVPQPGEEDHGAVVGSVKHWACDDDVEASLFGLGALSSLLVGLSRSVGVLLGYSSALSDSQALAAAQFIPEWYYGTEVRKGNVRRRSGALWRATKDHICYDENAPEAGGPWVMVEALPHEGEAVEDGVD